MSTDVYTNEGKRIATIDREALVAAEQMIDDAVTGAQKLQEYARDRAGALVAFHSTLKAGGLSLELCESLTKVFNDSRPEFRFWNPDAPYPMPPAQVAKTNS